MTLQACAELVERGDPDRFLATMAAPPAAREILFPLYAFNLEVSRAPWVTEEPMIAEMRLQFWRDVLDGVVDGQSARAHEVAGPVAGVLTPDTARILDGLVAARRWDAHKDPFEDQAAFDAYIDATAGTLAWVAAVSLGAPPAAEPVVRDAAWAHGVAGFLRAIPDLEARGRVPLVDGTPSGVRSLAERALARLAAARRARRTLDRRAAAALVAGWRAEPALRAARDIPERVIEGKLDESEFARRARLLWVSATGRW